MFVLQYRVFFSERTLFGRTRHARRSKPKRSPTLGVGVYRRTDTHWMRIAMGFSRRPGLASDATYIDRQLQAATNILLTQGDKRRRRSRRYHDNYYYLSLRVSKFRFLFNCVRDFFFVTLTVREKEETTVVVFVRFSSYFSILIPIIYDTAP